MSESDTESSCGWTVITGHEGSDIEPLVDDLERPPGMQTLEKPPGVQTDLPEKPPGVQTDLPEKPPGVQTDMQDQPTSLTAEHLGERGEPLDNTLREEDETLSEAGGQTAEKMVCSFSDYSDIVSLGDLKEDAMDEAPGREDLYLGTSSSSQYTFTTAETVPPVQPSDSSEDEAEDRVPSGVRRRRLRSSREDEPGRSEEEPGRDRAPPGAPGALNGCILLAVVVAIGLGCAHVYGVYGSYYGTVQTPERQSAVERVRVDLSPGPPAASKEVSGSLRGGEEGDVVASLRMKNRQLRLEQVQMQAQKDTLVKHLRRNADDKTKMESEHRKLAAENQLLKSSLERGEKSMSTLQGEVRNLRSRTADLEERGAGADSVRSENQRLKEDLEEEKRRIHDFLSQREALMVEVQTLRTEMDKERSVKDQLMAELELSRDGTAAGGETSAEMEELRSRLTELEEKLGFEQQRSDLWERLYVETKEEGAKGDTQSTGQRTKEGVILGKVKKTFDAVKNSTKEFVHHHKEQIKKAKEAVKENLRKFSDSVKSTFRYLKDSAFKPLQHRAPPHSRQKPTDDSFQGQQNTRKSGRKVPEDPERAGHKGVPRGCSGLFECAYQESTSLFDKATEPVRADEFHQLLQSYLHQEVDHFHHWKELEDFVSGFFHNGVFIHDRMLFTDFVSGVENYLEELHEYRGLDGDAFRDLDDYVYRHVFGDTRSEGRGPSGPVTEAEEELAGQDTDRQRGRREGHTDGQRGRREGQDTDRPRGRREGQDTDRQRGRREGHTDGQRGRREGQDTDRQRGRREGQDSDRQRGRREGQDTDRRRGRREGQDTDVRIELGPMPFDPKY